MNVNGHSVFGANYDWDTGVGMVMVNKRWVAKQSLTGRPVHWISQYASITLNHAIPTIALITSTSVYDSIYIALALRLDTRVITAYEEFYLA